MMEAVEKTELKSGNRENEEKTEQVMETEEDWCPKILGILCNWCSYAGADLAGVSRMQYPPSIRIVRVMCSGRVDIQFILEALKKGVDGVFIGGCHPGDCHYEKGNYKALRRVLLLKRLLPQLGISPDRVRLEWVSAAEGNKFQEVVTDFTNQIRALGPNKGVD